MIRSFIPFIAIIVAIALYFLQIAPGWETIKSLQVEKENLAKALENSNNIVKEQNSLKNQYDSFPPSDIARLETLLPDQVDVVRLLLDIDGVAAKYNIDLEAITVSESEDSNAGDAIPEVIPSADSTGDSTAVDSTMVDSTLVPAPGVAGEGSSAPISVSHTDVTIQISASYDDIQLFLNDLEQSLRIMDIQKFGFEADETANEEVYNITLRTYHLK